MLHAFTIHVSYWKGVPLADFGLSWTKLWEVWKVSFSLLLHMYPCTQWSQSQWHVGTCWHNYKFVCIIWATTVTTVPHQQTSSAIIVISPLRQSESQPRPEWGEAELRRSFTRAGAGAIILMVSTISLPRPKCSAVQGRAGEVIMLSASICRGEEARMAGTPGHCHQLQSSADGDGDTSVTPCHVTGDEWKDLSSIRCSHTSAVSQKQCFFGCCLVIY